MTSTRQLSAIMFTDIVGYTALMGKDSDKALNLVRISKEIQKPLVEKYNGKWLKEIGDGAMAQFSTALDAVNCSLEIQEIARGKLDARLRIGIHLGDITIEEDDVYGDGVNVASRLESIADAGGIYISESVEKSIQGLTNVKAIYLGEVNLKNVAYGVRTYALQGVGLPVPDVKANKQVSGHFAAEIQRRGVVRAAATYVVLSLLLILLVPYANSMVDLPDWSTTALISVLLVGLPIALYLAWNYERSPEGFVRTSSKESWQNPYKGSQRKPLTGNFIMVVMAIIIVVMYAYPRFTSSDKTTAASDPPDNSIAVLYFDNMSGNPDQEYFSDGMTEEIIAQLTKIDGIRVTSRSSTKVFKGKPLNIKKMGEELGVSYILEGSVRKADNQLRITVQLINTATDEHVWAHTYDKELTAVNIFEIQGDIARDIAQRFEVDITPETDLKISEIRTNNIEAYESYLLARHIAFNEYYWRPHDSIAFEKSRAYYEKAIERDPLLAEAYAGLADLYDAKFVNGVSLSDKEDSLRSSNINIALKLAPENSFVNSIKGWVVSKSPHRRDSAYYYLKKAFLLEPNNPENYRDFGGALQQFYGLSRECVMFREKAARLSPLDANMHFFLGIDFTIIGNFKRAEESHDRMITIEGDSTRSLGMRFIWALAEKDFERAERALKSYEDLHEIDFLSRAILFASQGQIDSARFLMEEYDIKVNNNFQLWYSGHLYYLVDKKEEFYQGLEELLDDGENLYQILSNTYYAESYRTDPDFERIMSKAKKLNDSYLAKVQDMMKYVE